MRRTTAQQLLNGIIEFLLIVLSYWASGYIREITPFGKPYVILDTRVFLPIGIAYAAVIVLVYFSTNSYARVKFSGFVKEGAKLVFTNLVGFGLMAGFLFIFNVAQFSRLLLLIFYFVSIIAVLIERKITITILGRKYDEEEAMTRVLIVGDGKLAKDFLQDLNEYEENRVNLAGCISRIDELKTILEKEKINQIYIAKEEISKDEVDYIMAIATKGGVAVGIVPNFTDYISSVKTPDVIGNSHVINMSNMYTCEIMGVDIAVSNMNKTLKLIEERYDDWRGKYICASNVHTTVMAYEDADYRRVQNGAVMALPDGGPLSEFSRDMGFAEARRVTGPDVMHKILEMSQEKEWRHYFYGSTEKTLEKMVNEIKKYSPDIKIAGVYSPPFRALSEAEDEQVIAMINDAKPDFVWVGLGAPKQEIWMNKHENKINALMIGVGAAFDYEAKNISRAPKWMQEHSLEWLYRLMQDPVRLFKRYVVTNCKYMWWKLWN